MTATTTHRPIEREQTFTDGVRRLRVGRTSVRFSERILLVVGGIVAPLGIMLVLLGYHGASNTPYLFEQVSYLISGGLLGVALVFLGAFFYFAHWLTQLVKEHRAQSAAMLQAIQRLQDEVARQGVAMASAGVPVTNGHHPDAVPAVELVATARGTMAHRPDCVVVTGKTGLRSVSAGDGLAACKLCDPDPGR